MGLHFIARGQHDRGSQGARRYSGDRDLASALLFLNGRMGGAFRRGDIFTRRGSPVGHARQSRIQFWEGTTFPLWDDLTLINCGGHFEGGTVLHWPAGAHGKGALLTSDILTVVQDRRYLSFMRSYPNLIPLAAAAIDRILETLEDFSFDQIYGGWWKANMLAHAKTAVARSAERYLRAIGHSTERLS